MRTCRPGNRGSPRAQGTRWHAMQAPNQGGMIEETRQESRHPQQILRSAFRIPWNGLAHAHMHMRIHMQAKRPMYAWCIHARVYNSAHELVILQVYAHKVHVECTRWFCRRRHVATWSFPATSAAPETPAQLAPAPYADVLFPRMSTRRGP